MSTYRDGILDLFRGGDGPVSTRMLAHRCLDAGVFDQEWQESAVIRAAQEECRGVLKGCDIHGLPIAGKTAETDDTGAPLWVQRELWDYDTYALNIGEYANQRDRNHEKALLLRNECRRKFGRAPAVSGLDGAGGIEGAAD
jgi:hypothetical protein